MKEKAYIAIDLKSFYASVECVSRGLDPMNTNLVVADESRTRKTICLAVSPSLRAMGIPGRARLFEVDKRVKEINAERLAKAPGHVFTGKSHQADELLRDPSLELEVLIAVPRMAHYITVSTQIYDTYLKYLAPEDMHVYSIDEVFMDVTSYLRTYQMTARELAMRMILEVLQDTGITATAGIGTNLYLCKIAMDIVAKHIPADENGVRIAELDELTYRKTLWTHTPITDFWRVGRGYAKKLADHGLFTMGDIARCSIGPENAYYNEDLLYKLFGVNAELLIDHAWGYEPCTMKDIHNYKPENNSIGSGQVLHCPYTAADARIVLREMADSLAMSLMEKGMVTDLLVMRVGYDISNLEKDYQGEITRDYYGRYSPKAAHASTRLSSATALSEEITYAALELYDRIVDPELLVRRLYLTAGHVLSEAEAQTDRQLSLFTDFHMEDKTPDQSEGKKKKQRQLQEAMLSIQKRYGKNAVMKGTSLQEGATQRERNRQIGGHKA